LYLGASSDSILHIFNENLLHLSALDLPEARLVTQAVFLEKEGHLVLGTIGGCSSYYLEVGCKHDPNSNLTLNPKGDRMVFKLHPDREMENSPPWCKGLRYQDNSTPPGEELLVAWSLDRVCVYTYRQIPGREWGGEHPKLQTTLLHSFTDVTDPDDSIQFVYVLKKLLTFAVATVGGRLKVYKFTKAKPLFEEFARMAKPIVEMQEHPMQEGYVVAAGLDGNLRIFDLRKSDPLFIFKLPDGLVKFKFLTVHHFMMHLKTGEVQIGRMFFPAKIMLRSNQMV
jgi:hypothetical protein